MLPIRLEIKNFLAYRSPDPILFDGIHLACITGANGAGKSSLLDAITWALWGKARARRDEDLVHLGQTDMYVQLDFEQEGTIYRVIRRRTRKSGGAGTLDLFVVDEGSLETRSEPSVRATQQKINDLLRLDYETFVHSAFLQQGKADAFTTKAPAQRKQILSDILGLDRWTAYEDNAKEQLKRVTEQLAGIEAVIAKIDEDLSAEPGLQQELEDAQQAQEAAQLALDAADARLREVENAPNDLRNANEQKAAFERRIRERQRDLDNVATEIRAQRERIASFESVIAVRAEIEQGYAVLQAARETDHSLGDKLFALNEVDRERHELERKLDAARAELQKEASRCESAILQLERTMNAARPDDLSVLQAEIMALEDLEQQRDDFQAEVQAMETDRAERKGGNEKLRIEMLELKDRIDRLSVATGAACPLCGQLLSEDHRVEILGELKAEGTFKGDTFRANVQAVEAMGDQITERKRYVAELNLELKRFSALKERAAGLQAGVDAANEASSRLAEQQAQLDAVLTQLADEDFGAEIREQLAGLEARRVALGYDGDMHNAARQQIDTYREYESRQKTLEIADAALPDMRAALDGAEIRQDRFQTALTEDQTGLTAILTEIATLEVLVREYHARDQEARLLRTAERNANERLIIARQTLKSLDAQKARKADLEQQREDKRYQKVVYEELRTAFGKNGIPAMIIETAIPELEAAANGILTRMTDGRMNLNMTTQREKVTGGVAETLDIQIADELGTRSYEMYSGGEAFRINFAIRVALSQMLARRAGAQLRTLFLDEGFGTQDEDGRNKLVEAITTVQEDFDMILIITHIDELRDSFPVHIMLNKTGEGSHVSVR